jgi:phospholipase C
MAADGGSETQLTMGRASDSEPAWSPDGTRIAFTTNRTGNDDVFVMNADGTGAVDVTNDPASDSEPAWSPDGGTRLAFTSDRAGQADVYVANSIDGSGAVDASGRAGADTHPSWQPLPATATLGTPIRHVVIVYQENHSFDNVLGRFCSTTGRCDGVTSGTLADGSTIPLGSAPDYVPQINHDGQAQLRAIDHGAMDGFSRLGGCSASTGYACYTTFDQQRIPNLWALARSFALSDRTFELDTIPSWQGHLELAASQLDGFAFAKNPSGGPGGGAGWGCDSGHKADWRGTVWSAVISVPACVPTRAGAGAYKPTPVAWVPTIMDRLDGAGLSWRIYAASATEGFAYGWAICPTFADCLAGPQHQNVVEPSQFAGAAASADMPSVSLVMPLKPDSQHNQDSMVRGDNWIGSVVSAVMNGPNWDSTAIFITYDDCGCFYDHVAPPPGLGIRVPMVIVSPYATAGFTDSNVASFDSMLAYVEHTFGLAPLSDRDAGAYDFSASFDYTQTPRRPITLRAHRVSRSVLRRVASQPPDPEDPT